MYAEIYLNGKVSGNIMMLDEDNNVDIDSIRIRMIYRCRHPRRLVAIHLPFYAT